MNDFSLVLIAYFVEFLMILLIKDIFSSDFKYFHRIKQRFGSSKFVNVVHFISIYEVCRFIKFWVALFSCLYKIKRLKILFRHFHLLLLNIPIVKSIIFLRSILYLQKRFYRLSLFKISSYFAHVLIIKILFHCLL